MSPAVDPNEYRARVPRLRAQLAARDQNPIAWPRERVAATQLSLGTALYYGFGDAAGACAAWLASMDSSPSAKALANLEQVAGRSGNAALAARCGALRALLFPSGEAAKPGTKPGAPASARRPRLAIYTGYGAPYTGASFGARPVFGSEIAAVKLAEALAAEGSYEVTVFSPCNGEEEPGGVNGVTYLHLSQYDAWSRLDAVDTLIVSRYMHFFVEFEPRARQVILWLHDLAPHYQWADRALPATGSAFFANALPLIDRVVCLSPWHARALLEWMRAQRCSERALALAAARSCVVGDALDPRDLPAEPVPRVPARLVFCSDPDRGLVPLLSIFRRLRERVPEATLHVYWSHLAAPHDAEMQRTAGARFMGKVAPPELARALAAAELMLYPNLGHETYCMAALEAQAAGCVVICRDHSGLATTVGEGCGVRLPGEAVDAAWEERALAAALELLSTDRARMHEMSRRATQWARAQTWDARVAEDWMPRVLRPGTAA